MTLTVIIPVWNEPQGLTRLLLQLRDLEIADQVIISDDGSDIPCSPAMVADQSRLLRAPVPLDAYDPLPGTELIWLRSDTSLGAGHARNQAARRATGTHVLFFDADDLLTPQIVDILADLGGMSFDFAMFRHHDTRLLDRGGTGMLEPDASYWATAVPQREGIHLLSHEGALSLCRVSAYPWNKIWRRDFLEQHAIACTEIPVHNDIEPHWSGFLTAENILCTSQVGCVHSVNPGRAQLTNRRGIDRLGVFEAFTAVLGRLQHAIARDIRMARFADPFFDFCLRLLQWIQGRMDGPETRAALMRGQDRFVRQLANPGTGALAAAIELALLRNPALASLAAPQLMRAA